MNRLEGKISLITGAGSGIGRGIALGFAKENSFVIVADISETKGNETLSLIESSGGRGLFIKADVSDEISVAEMAENIQKTMGRLDVLVNNAGIFNIETEKVADLPTEKWDRIIAVNLRGTFLCIKHCVPLLLKSDSASIISISSPAGMELSIRAAYGASKAGIISLTKSIAIQYPDEIRANCICPGSIDTPAREASRRTNVHPPSFDRLIQRDGTSEDIAAAAVFLASGEASFITATVLRVDGGILGQRPKPKETI